MFSWLKTNVANAPQHHAIPDDEWSAALRIELPVLDHYDAATLGRLRELTTLFSSRKHRPGRRRRRRYALEVTSHMRAC